MTRAEFHYDQDVYTVIAKGHAEGPSDQVCAGVSAILYALAGYILNCPNIDCISMQMESGDAEICFAGYQEAEAAFMMAFIGLMQISLENSSYLTVEKDF